jgi:hypothetical protein
LQHFVRCGLEQRRASGYFAILQNRKYSNLGERDEKDEHDWRNSHWSCNAVRSSDLASSIPR